MKTSPRLRGEVDARSYASGEGDFPQAEFAESPPHPDPLPASGEREAHRTFALVATYLASSILAMVSRCTSSGPSARRSVRECA